MSDDDAYLRRPVNEAMVTGRLVDIGPSGLISIKPEIVYPTVPVLRSTLGALVDVNRSRPARPATGANLMPGETLYNASGQAVAVVTQITVSTMDIDVSSFESAKREFIPGPRNVEIVCSGLGRIIKLCDAADNVIETIPWGADQKGKAR